MLSRQFASVVLAAVFFNAASPAFACRVTPGHFLLRQLPDGAMDKPVVAKVRIVEVVPPLPRFKSLKLYSSTVRVEVVEAIKGVELGQRFTIVSSSQCGGPRYPVDMTPSQMAELTSESPFIAGAFTGVLPKNIGTPWLDAERVFRGNWQFYY